MKKTDCIEEQIQDSAVKSYALAHWDLNRDGCVSRENEAPLVTSIPANAFKNNTSISSLADFNLFTNLKTIGNNAFEGCSNISKVDLANITTVGEGAFKNSSVSDIKLSIVKTIPKSMCENCSSLRSIDFPAATSIGNYAFYQTDVLKTVKINNVKIIGDHAFALNSSIETLNLPSVSKIGDAAFWLIPTLTKVTLDNDGMGIEIGNAAFYSCENLQEITGGNIVRVGESAFTFCSALESIQLASTVSSLGERAFEECTKLTDITGDGSNIINIDKLPQKVFRATGLKHITINQLKELESGAFEDCPDLEDVVINGDEVLEMVTDHLPGDCEDYDENCLHQIINHEHFNWMAFRNSRKVKLTLSPLPQNTNWYCKRSSDLNFAQLTTYTLGNIYSSENFKDCTIFRRIVSYADFVPKHTFDGIQVDSISLPNATTIMEQAFVHARFSHEHEDENYFGKVKTIEKYGFYDSNLKKMSFPSVERVEDKAFGYAYMLEQIYLPKLNYQGRDLFEDTNILSITKSSCTQITNNETCSSSTSTRYCIQPERNVGIINTYWLLNWKCPSGTTCRKDSYGHKICE
jgi:hypothetical protein